MHGGGNCRSWGANYAPGPSIAHHQQPSPEYSNNMYTPGAPSYAPPSHGTPPPSGAPSLYAPPPMVLSSPYDFPSHNSFTPAHEPTIIIPDHPNSVESSLQFNPNSYYAPTVPSYNFDHGYGALPAPASLGFEQVGSPGGRYMQGGGTMLLPAYAPGQFGSSPGGRGAPSYDGQVFGPGGGPGIGDMVYAYDGGGGQGGRQGQGFEAAYGSSSSSHMSSWNSGGFEGGGGGGCVAAAGSLASYYNNNSSNNNFKDLGGGGSKVLRATPKVDTYDSGGGVQKYRVKLLPDSKDVICQIGLDGVRMLDPGTSVTLRIYPLETIERWEVTEPSVFTFWAKSAVDVEMRAIRLKSSSYMTGAILDTITAACVQLSEMVAKDGPNKGSGGTSPATAPVIQRKSSIVDWVTIRPLALTPEEKQHWVPDEAATKCSNCGVEFSAFNRRHHCRNCGDLFCDRCTQGRTALTAEADAEVVRVCDRCLAEVTHRLSDTKETSNKVPVLRTHEDLAKTLQEELERNAGRKAERSGGGQDSDSRSTAGNSSSGTSVLSCSKCGSISLVKGSVSCCPSCGAATNRYPPPQPNYSAGSDAHMREVACPTCTVHLQVQVPSFGTETVECGVCQHPFLVSAN